MGKEPITYHVIPSTSGNKWGILKPGAKKFSRVYRHKEAAILNAMVGTPFYQSKEPFNVTFSRINSALYKNKVIVHKSDGTVDYVNYPLP